MLRTTSTCVDAASSTTTPRRPGANPEAASAVATWLSRKPPDGGVQDDMEYLHIATGPSRCEAKDEDPAVLRAPVLKLFRSLGRGHKGQTLKTQLVVTPVVYTSAAGTALSINDVITFNTATIAELSSFLVIFDEARVLRIHHHFTPAITTSSTVQNIVYGSFCTYQDNDNVALATTYGALQADHNTGIIALQSTTGASQNPLKHFKVTMPLKPATVVGTSSPGSSWFDMDQAPIIYQIGGYMSNSTPAVIQLLSYSLIDVEFRSRT